MIFPDEDAFTGRLARLFPAAPPARVAVGDDAAVLDLPRGRYLFTTDTLVEKVDFPAGERPYWVGRRAAAANLSDLAAMGARPVGYLLTLGVPRKKGLGFAWSVARGVSSKMSAAGAALWGGDLTRSAEVFVSVAAIGRSDRPVRRSGARPGDIVFVTGSPGDSFRGRQSRKRGSARPTALERAYLDPPTRLSFASRLARRNLATSMIDVSDGLGRDAGRLARASRVRIDLAEIDLDRVKQSGDDFELLFTSPRRREAEVREVARLTKTAVSRIGRVAAGRGVSWTGGGRKIALENWGYDHFRR
jgi:thiamine-monophosphate kinase